ncbi:unnamed protein product [Phaeothamnion confervicola]
MDFDDPTLLRFLGPQLRDHGAQTELDAGLWTLFAIPAADTEAHAIAHALLATATFAHDSGLTEDDRWMLHYVDTANRPAARAWLDDTSKLLAGEIRPPAPAHRALAAELITSPKPHRLAQDLAALHTRGELGAGLFRKPADVRALLDRLHQCEPLFFAAFLTLLTNHLVDMLVLHRQLLPEDIALKNEIVRGGLSRDPFLQSRQDAAGEIRNFLLLFQLINPIDQQKNTTIANPYAVHLEVVVAGDEVTAPIDGIAVALTRENFLAALRSIRRNLYRGEEFRSFDTQAPWMNEQIAYPFRFIKQRIESRPDLSTMDALYLLERAVSG